MRKLILTFALLVSAVASLSAQQVCFWTNEYKTLPIRIYVDEQYVGDITASFDKAPAYGTEGTLSIELTPGTHDVAAVNAYGYEYDGWPGTIRPDETKVNYVKLRRDKFPYYTSLGYIVYDPYWYGLDYGPYYHHHHHHYSSASADHSIDELEDGDLNSQFAAWISRHFVGQPVASLLSISTGALNYQQALCIIASSSTHGIDKCLLIFH